MEQNPLNPSVSNFVLHPRSNPELVNLGQNLRIYVFLQIGAIILGILAIVLESIGLILITGIIGFLLIICEILFIVRFKHINDYQSLPATKKAFLYLLWAFVVDIISFIITMSYTYEITIPLFSTFEYTFEPLDLISSIIKAVFTVIAWSGFNNFIESYGSMSRNKESVENISKGIQKIKICVFLSLVPFVNFISDFVLLYGWYQIGANLKKEFQVETAFYHPEYPGSMNYSPAGSPLPPNTLSLPSNEPVTSMRSQSVFPPSPQFSSNLAQRTQIQPELKKCHNCGADIVENAQFCSVCGANQK